ncbi:hypothetical protein [Aquirufa aurantiipilula]
MKGFYHIVCLKLKSRNIAFILLLIIGSNFACKKITSPSLILQKLIIENGKTIEPYFSGYVLLIPNDGCHPCIQKAITCAKKNLKKRNIYFVITTDYDFKSTKLKFSKNDLMSNNLVFDLLKKSNQLGLRNSSLTIFYFKDGQMIYEKAINPTNASFDLLVLQSRLNFTNG